MNVGSFRRSVDSLVEHERIKKLTERKIRNLDICGFY
jgi:hypothetical protein